LPVNEYAFQRAGVWPLNPTGELFAMIMIETAEGVKNIDDIITVPGIGAIFLGASDLGVSLGVVPAGPGAVNPPENGPAGQKVPKSCLSRKVGCAYPVLGGETELKQRTAEGFKVLLVAGRSARP